MFMTKMVALLLLMVLVGSAAAKFRADQPDPKLAQAWIAAGKAWYDKQEWVRAQKCFDEAIKADPKSDDAYVGRATVLLHLKEWDKAIKDFDEAIRLNPKRGAAFGNRGVAWAKKKEFEKAMADYNEAIRLQPTYAPAYQSRGEIWGHRGDYEKAVEDFSHAIRLDPKFLSAIVDRGIAWQTIGNYEKALMDFDVALGLDPKKISALYGRAWLRATCPEAKFRDGAKAIEDAKAAYDQKGDHLAFRCEALAAAYAETGQFDEAIKWQKKALDDSAYVKEKGDSVRERLKLYEAKKPYRDLPPPESSKK